MGSYGKIVWRTIRDSFVRFIAILSIIALGVGFFAGLKVTTPSFLETGNKFITDYKMFDYRLISTIGFSKEDIEKLQNLDYVESAAGAYFTDVITDYSSIVRLHSITSGVNELKVVHGRLPIATNEIVVDDYRLDESVIGKKISIPEGVNESSVLDGLVEHEFTIVGTVRSPLYLNFQRGTTDVGSGSISYFAFALEDLWDAEYYSEAYVYCNTGYYIFSDEYENFDEKVKPVLEDELLKIETDRYAELLQDSFEELEEARQEFIDNRNDAEKELNDAWQKIVDARQELSDADTELKDARQELDDASVEINDGRSELNSTERDLEDKLRDIVLGIGSIEDGLNTCAETRAELESKLEEATAGLTQINQAIELIDASLAQYGIVLGKTSYIQGNRFFGDEYEPEIPSETLPSSSEIPTEVTPSVTEEVMPGDDPTTNPSETTTESQVEETTPIPSESDNPGVDVPQLPDLTEIMTQYNALVEQRTQVENGINEINSGLSQLDATEADLKEKLEELETYKAQVEDGLNQIDSARTELINAQRDVADAEIEYADGLEEYNNGVKDFNDGVREYFEGVSTFKSEISQFARTLGYAFKQYNEAAQKEPEVYVLGRDTNVGYVCFDSDSKIVDGIATVFPIFFFAIAALVCSTTMQRMVSDERGQIGTMRALGYSETAVMMKYIIYSGSASLIGCIFGFAVGSKVFPYVIWMVYGVMYGFADITFKTSIPVFIVCLLASLLCSVGVTVVTAASEMKGMPAELIRPKAPLAGKRILLERVSFIWNKLPFLHKVSLRNIFRFKKRMMMMIIGIAGCTSLLITGFGLNDSIKNIVGFQYDSVLVYDVSVNFDEEMDGTKMNSAIEEADKKFNTTSRVVYAVQENLTHNGLDVIRDVTLIVTDSNNVSDAFVGAVDGKAMPWPGDNEVAISSKLAKSNNINAGDMITFSYGDKGQTFTLKVAYVFDNYIFHYAFMNVKTYEDVMNETYDPHHAFISRFASDGVTTLSPETDYDYASFISSNNDVVSWGVVNESRIMFGNTMEQLNAVVILVIICAALLAFIVLFNLNNINITERVREIATLKVLGFNKSETGSYVFRENFILVIFGFIVGIPLGKALHAFVISQIKMDTVTFVVQIFKISYLYSFLLVILFAVATDVVMRGKIRKIDMAESLKSIE